MPRGRMLRRREIALPPPAASRQSRMCVREGLHDHDRRQEKGGGRRRVKNGGLRKCGEAAQLIVIHLERTNRFAILQEPGGAGIRVRLPAVRIRNTATGVGSPRPQIQALHFWTPLQKDFAHPYNLSIILLL